MPLKLMKKIRKKLLNPVLAELVNTNEQLSVLKVQVEQLEQNVLITDIQIPEWAKFYGQFEVPVDEFILNRYFPDFNIKGVFVECGAFDGRTDSSCKFFEEYMGWTGYNFEPVPWIYEKLCKNRPNSNNYNLAMSNAVTSSTFTVVNHPDLEWDTGIGSIQHTEEAKKIWEDANCTFKDITVSLTTWSEFIKTNQVNYVDLFVLDVEGHELSVIEGMRGCPVLPDIMCVECDKVSISDIKIKLQELGYVYDTSSFVNAFFIKEEKVPLFNFRQINKRNSNEMLN